MDEPGGVTAVDREQHGLAWREAGEGEPLVFLHGLGGSRSAWGPQLRDLSDRYRCVAWDMPGYGASAPVDPLTFPAIAGRLIDLLDTIDVDRATLVGLSFGGMHALHTALDHPERIRRLVLADTSPAFGLDGTTRATWIASRLGPIDAGGHVVDAAETIIDAITHVRLDGNVRTETIEAFRRIPDDGFRAAVHCLPDHDVRARLGEIEHPTLVVVGEHDEETPPSYAQMLAERLSNAALVTIDGVGHLSPAEAPRRFNNAVRAFLDSTHHETTP